MVAEYIDKDKRAIPETERHDFYVKHVAPKNWRIWIGRHRREQYGMFSHNTLSFTTEEEFKRCPSTPAREVNTQTSTICLGEHLLIHVMSSAVAHSIIRRWKLPVAIAPNLTQIWPVRRSVVSWPPTFALTDAGLDLLANEFINKARALAREKAISG
jgi:hypothetical protein